MEKKLFFILCVLFSIKTHTAYSADLKTSILDTNLSLCLTTLENIKLTAEEKKLFLELAQNKIDIWQKVTHSGTFFNWHNRTSSRLYGYSLLSFWLAFHATRNSSLCCTHKDLFPMLNMSTFQRLFISSSIVFAVSTNYFYKEAVKAVLKDKAYHEKGLEDATDIRELIYLN